MKRAPRGRRSQAARWGLALAGVGLVACQPRSSNRPRLRWATQPAVGAPATCPDDAVDPTAPGVAGSSAMDLRCSYADTAAGVPTRLRGQVVLEASTELLGKSPGRHEVTVHRAPSTIDGPLGPAVAHTTTDPQGSFLVAALLRPGDYVIAVLGSTGAHPLAQRRVVVGADGGYQLDGLRLVIPRRASLAPDR